MTLDQILNQLVRVEQAIRWAASESDDLSIRDGLEDSADSLDRLYIDIEQFRNTIEEML